MEAVFKESIVCSLSIPSKSIASANDIFVGDRTPSKIDWINAFDGDDNCSRFDRVDGCAVHAQGSSSALCGSRGGTWILRESPHPDKRRSRGSAPSTTLILGGTRGRRRCSHLHGNTRFFKGNEERKGLTDGFKT